MIHYYLITLHDCITVTAKLEYNEHGYNKLTAAAIMNNCSCPDKVLIYKPTEDCSI